jgi:chemotaxis protein MotB
MAGKGGGGAWKVAYADFVTAMMAFFLVMWIVAQNKPVREAVAQYFKNPLASAGPPSGPPARIALEGGLPHFRSIAPAQRGHGRSLSETDDDASAHGASKAFGPKLPAHDKDASRTGALIQFAEDSAELDEQAREHLQAMIPGLLGKPNRIEIRGHATGRPLPASSRYADAWQLSYARSVATMKFFIEQGIEPNRIRLSQGGAFEPQGKPGEVDWAAQNSRVEVYILSEFVQTAPHAPLENAALESNGN